MDKLEEKVISLLDSGTDDWRKLEGMTEIQDIERIASHLCQQAARLSEYCEWRGAAGCGDHGHEEALEKAKKMVKKVRKALGYSFP